MGDTDPRTLAPDVLVQQRDAAWQQVLATGKADPYDAAAYAAAQRHYQRLEAERQRRVMLAMRSA